MAIILLVIVLITETVLLIMLVTYILVPSGLTAIPKGSDSTSNVDVTLFLVVSIMETLLLPAFVTYTSFPPGFIATPQGKSPTFTVDVTLFKAMSITETVLLPAFVIYAYGSALAILTRIKSIRIVIPKAFKSVCSLLALLFVTGLIFSLYILISILMIKTSY